MKILWMLICCLSISACGTDNDPADLCQPNPCTETDRTLCVVEGEAYRCDCVAGSHLEDDTCVDDDPIDPCLPNPCTETDRTLCVVEGEAYRCDCVAGTHLAGSTCVDDDPIDPCLPNPCTETNRTLCVVEADGYRCDCVAGTHLQDDTCVDDEPIDPCLPNPCTETNRTLCVVEGESYRCDCVAGTHLQDDTCVEDDPIDPCLPNPCTDTNRTLCVVEGESYRCDCVAGTHLQDDTCLADDPTDPCLPNPCTEILRTRCRQDGEGGYECWCDVDYHDDDGLCCPAYAENVADQCQCIATHIDPDDSGECIVRCAESSIEGLNGYCPADQVCVQGICIANVCVDVLCPEHAACVVRGDVGECQCDTPYHMSEDLCCLQNASNVEEVCTCDPGYVADAAGDCQAEPDNPCEPNPCQDLGWHRNLCVPDSSAEGYTCDCNVGYQDQSGQCVLTQWDACPDGLSCQEGYCLPADLSAEQCLVDADCREFDVNAPTTCNADAAGGICRGCFYDSDCPDNSQCNPYGTCANLCDDDNDCPYGRCYSAVGYCGQKICVSDQDCFQSTVCVDADGDGSGQCHRIPCQ